MTQMVQYCFLPRLLLSPMDTVYCVKMIRTLYKMGTPGFSTAICYDRLVGEQVGVLITSCSDKEIANYGNYR